MTPYEKLDKRLEEIGGCGSSGCIVHQRKGMHTNGPCQCSRQPFKMQQVIHAYKSFRKEVEE